MNQPLQTVLSLVRRSAPATVLTALGAFACISSTAQAQQATGAGRLTTATADLQKKAEEALVELAELEKRITEDTLPLSRRLAELEAEQRTAETEELAVTRELDRATLGVDNLASTVKAGDAERDYLSGLLGSYVSEFEARLHVTEVQRYEEDLEAAKLAPENAQLSDVEVFTTQLGALNLSLTRLEEGLGGTRFAGTAVDPEGNVQNGTFALVGPVAYFVTQDGKQAGLADERFGSMEPTMLALPTPELTAAAKAIAATGEGNAPFDPTLGSALKMAATEITLLQEVKKGGNVMWPIFIMAGAALLVAIYKWISLAFVRRPSRKNVTALIQAVAAKDREAIERKAKAIHGPAGVMLRAGAEHIEEPRELVEEVMFERVMKTKLKLNSLLPFIAICAAAAPLLGLLGTVTGIIETFKLITVFGSGDVKMLSGGISEALITTKYGLIVAIPSLMLHAYLSRKARRIVGSMETTAVEFINQVARTPFVESARSAPSQSVLAGGAATVSPDPAAVRAQVHEILQELLGPISGNGTASTVGNGNGNGSGLPVAPGRPAARKTASTA